MRAYTILLRMSSYFAKWANKIKLAVVEKTFLVGSFETFVQVIDFNDRLLQKLISLVLLNLSYVNK